MTLESITKAVIKGHEKMLKDCADILPGTPRQSISSGLTEEEKTIMWNCGVSGIDSIPVAFKKLIAEIKRIKDIAKKIEEITRPE